MAKRQSINTPVARHENPIPNASRIGNLVMSSVIGGLNPGTRELPPTLEQQVANVFANLRSDVEAAGGTVVIQNPETAQFPAMPESLAPTTVDISPMDGSNRSTRGVRGLLLSLAPGAGTCSFKRCSIFTSRKAGGNPLPFTPSSGRGL